MLSSCIIRGEIKERGESEAILRGKRKGEENKKEVAEVAREKREGQERGGERKEGVRRRNGCNCI